MPEGSMYFITKTTDGDRAQRKCSYFIIHQFSISKYLFCKRKMPHETKKSKSAQGRKK